MTGKSKKQKKRAPVPTWTRVKPEAEIKDDLDQLPDFMKNKLEKPEYQPDFIEDNAVTQKLAIQKQKEELEQEKKDWIEYCARKKKEEDPIEKYCYEIREEMPDYELSYEENKRAEREGWDERQEIMKDERKHQIALKELDERRDKMSEKEYAKERKMIRRLEREEMKQQELDSRLEQQSPYHVFLKRVEKIGCRCSGEAIRNGMYCNTCRFIMKLDNNMLRMFKDAAEGRS